MQTFKGEFGHIVGTVRPLRAFIAAAAVGGGLQPSFALDALDSTDHDPSIVDDILALLRATFLKAYDASEGDARFNTIIAEYDGYGMLLRWITAADNTISLRLYLHEGSRVILDHGRTAPTLHMRFGDESQTFRDRVWVAVGASNACSGRVLFGTDDRCVDVWDDFTLEEAFVAR